MRRYVLPVAALGGALALGWAALPGWEPLERDPAATIGPEADRKAEALWVQFFRDRPPAQQPSGRAEMLRMREVRDNQPDALCAALASDGGAAVP